MIVTASPSADVAQLQRALIEKGLWVRRLTTHGGGPTLLQVEAYSAHLSGEDLLLVPGVQSVSAAPSDHPLVDKQAQVVHVGGVAIGVGAAPVFMAGPCSVESEEQIHRLAAQLAAIGVRFLRGGAYKPRTSPYSFQGQGEVALRWLHEAATKNGLLVVTELMGAEEATVVAEHTDLVQIGSRNMANYSLLRTIARLHRPVLLKRGMAATVEEWLSAGEYCLLHGAASVIFCERGIRGFDGSTRNLLDLSAVALLAHVHRQPVLVDPSHAVGRRDLIPALSRAALAAGAAGLLIEVHDTPGCALSDGPQALLPTQLQALIQSCVAVTGATHTVP
ncbi:MAG: 3-deoxy-7-phosphoheptulonate synthase [Deltaproteobacteria bacterium]|nr:3-deoxy-7-phosphoheptulonate synthase [Deltaproteobacteria bacterium]